MNAPCSDGALTDGCNRHQTRIALSPIRTLRTKIVTSRQARGEQPSTLKKRQSRRAIACESSYLGQNGVIYLLRFCEKAQICRLIAPGPNPFKWPLITFKKRRFLAQAMGTDHRVRQRINPKKNSSSRLSVRQKIQEQFSSHIRGQDFAGWLHASDRTRRLHPVSKLRVREKTTATYASINLSLL